MDRTVKLLLTAIVILLAAIVFRPNIPFGASAMAQSASSQTIVPVPGNPNQVDMGIIVTSPSKIAVPTGQYVRDLQIMDNANSFIVRYDDRIEVYHVQVVQVDRSTLTPAQQAALGTH